MGSFITSDGVIIKNLRVLVYLSQKNKVVNFGFALDLKQCVNANLLRKEFGFLIALPTQLHAITTEPLAVYTADEWGRFAMGEIMSIPGCAEWIGISNFSNEEKRKEWRDYVRENAPYLRAREQ